MKTDRSLKDALDALEQYSRRNSLRFFGILESAKPNIYSDDIVMNVCKSMGAYVSVGDIKCSHRTGKPRGRRPRHIIVKCVSYRARQKLYSLRPNLKTNTEHASVFINCDLTQRRSQLLFVAICINNKPIMYLDHTIISEIKVMGSCKQKLNPDLQQLNKMNYVCSLFCTGNYFFNYGYRNLFI